MMGKTSSTADALPLSTLPQKPFACRRVNLPAKRHGCGNFGPPFSAAGSGEPQFPVRGEGNIPQFISSAFPG